MNVEISPDVRDAASQLGGGVPYALRVLAGQLADDPDMGLPSGLPGVLTVTVEGDVFEDCPALSVGYIREADRIEIRYLKPIPSPDADDQSQEQGQGHPASAVEAALVVREIADAWHRIVRWLQRRAPDSYAALRAGASPAAIAALEGSFGMQVPIELRCLWSLTAGDDGVNGWGCLPGNRALMPLEAVAAVYQLKMDSQIHQDALDTGRSEDEQITVWKPTWIPVVALGPADRTSGLYLDAATGYLGRWSRYNEGPGKERDTLATYLEDVADMLEAPALATRDKPGLVGAALVWGSRLDSLQEERWQPLTS
ncbi:hypothetical protein AB0F77_31445 [Streptomyces sp. NPDC026672]|uniref:hypothetical protein n=1 Tax=unclassified Streptomyces TaxID=2593676 RepID=UPI0033D4032A